MARPEKVGIDYFSFDSDYSDHPRVKFILAEFGAKGYVVAVELTAYIYRHFGYYMKWSEENQLLFANSVAWSGASVNLIVEIVSRLIKWGYFNKSVFDSAEVLTSKRFQKSYIEATRKRKNGGVIYEYNLLNDAQKEFSAEETPKKAEETPTKGEESAQSKGNETKGNKKSRKKTTQPDALQFPFTSPNFINAWNKLVVIPKWKSKPLSALQLSLDKLKRYDEQFAIELIETAHSNNNQGVVYPDTDEKYERWKKRKTTTGIKTDTTGTRGAIDDLVSEIERTQC